MLLLAAPGDGGILPLRKKKYIGGCGDSPERVAEVNRIKAETAKKKAEQQRQYQEQAAEAASQGGDFLRKL